MFFKKLWAPNGALGVRASLAYESFTSVNLPTTPFCVLA
jgi:hypothetical protein